MKSCRWKEIVGTVPFMLALHHHYLIKCLNNRGKTICISNKNMECNKSCFKKSCRWKGMVSTVYLVFALLDHYIIKCLSKRGKRNCRLSTATEQNNLMHLLHFSWTNQTVIATLNIFSNVLIGWNITLDWKQLLAIFNVCGRRGEEQKHNATN